MKVSVSNKDIIRLAAPISLALLIPQISFLTNTAFLGRLGEVELGVNGISGIFYLTLSMIGYGLSNGMQVQMARRAGEGDNEGLAKTLTNGVMLSTLLSLVLMMLSLWAAPRWTVRPPGTSSRRSRRKRKFFSAASTLKPSSG